MERGQTGVLGRLGRVALACAWVGTAAAAEDPAGGSSGAPPQVDLEKLLELPGDVRYDVEKKGGATQGEWRARFQKVRNELVLERAALERSQLELEKVAGSADAWQLAPPGVSSNRSETPLDFRLRNEIRQHRAEVDRLERQLRDLDVEANLAGVPEAWRE